MRKLFVLFIGTALAVVVASAATKYNVTLYQASNVNGTQLKPGDYKIEVTGDKATFKLGKTAFEAPVKVEDTTAKNSSTALRYVEGGKLLEIRVGGTRTKLVFESTPAENSDVR